MTGETPFARSQVLRFTRSRRELRVESEELRVEGTEALHPLRASVFQLFTLNSSLFTPAVHCFAGARLRRRYRGSE